MPRRPKSEAQVMAELREEDDLRHLAHAERGPAVEAPPDPGRFDVDTWVPAPHLGPGVELYYPAGSPKPR